MESSALYFLLGVLLGYPIAFVFNVFIAKSTNQTFKHLYSGFSGVFLGLLCFGPSIVNLMITIIITYALMAFLPRSVTAMQIPIFLFNMGYLLLEYYFVSSAESYDIDFTTAHCVLTLRLIGLGWDYVDGALPDKEQEKYQQENSLKTLPSLLEVFAYSFHWGGFLVGPQFSFRTYSSLISGDIWAQKGGNGKPQPLPLAPMLRSFLLGVHYLALTSVVGGYFPVGYVVEEGFLNLPLLQRLGYVWVSTRLRIYVYAGMWMLTEGHCILSGLGFNGVDEKGNAKWNRVTNFIPALFETTDSLTGYVLSFNINTNAWVKEYVLKRLRFLGSKELSSLISLLFLAIWHGFAPGYFITFVTEFFEVMTEQKLKRIMLPIRTHPLWESPLGNRVGTVIGFLLASLGCSYGFLAFEVKTLEKTIIGYGSIGWIGHIFMAVVLVLDFLVGRRIKKAFDPAYRKKTPEGPQEAHTKAE